MSTNIPLDLSAKDRSFALTLEWPEKKKERKIKNWIQFL